MKSDSRDEYAPIILFVYNRLDHVKKVISALKDNAEASGSLLYIYSDDASKVEDVLGVQKVRDYINGISGFRDVIVTEREENFGIEKSELEGVTEVLAKHGRAIILEDDIQVSNQFLRYMNYCLNEYEADKSIYTVTGYSFLKTAPDNGGLFGRTKSFAAWGWGTWNDRWMNLKRTIGKNDLKYAMDHKRSFDNGQDYSYLLMHQYKNNCLTWDVAWLLSCFENDGLTVFPCNTMVNNIGMDGSGVHYSGDSEGNRVENINDRGEIKFPLKFMADDEVALRLEAELREQNQYSLIKRLKMAVRVRLNYYEMLISGPGSVEIRTGNDTYL